MLCGAPGRVCPKRIVLIFLGVGLFFAAISAADARTSRRHTRKTNAFQVALQPFSLARSVVHAVADPIVEPVLRNAPRVLAAAATAPVRVAYHAARSAREEDEEEDFESDAPNEGRAYAGRPVRLAERENFAEPMRVAYVVPQGGRAVAAPRAEEVEDEQEKQQDQEPVQIESGGKPMVAGSRAVLRNGIACAPSQAPQSVKNAIWAANGLRRKPYVWGGGHGSFNDGGYDCSGTVSFALHGAGVLASPIPSSELTRFGERGRGRWFTIYSRPGHTFAVIAGLRLDTTDFQDGGNTGPRWHEDMRDTGGYVARHPAGM